MNGSYLIAIAFCCAVGPALLCLWNMLLYREPGATGSYPPWELRTARLHLRPHPRAQRRECNRRLPRKRPGLPWHWLRSDCARRCLDRPYCGNRPWHRCTGPTRSTESSAALPRGWNGKQHACYTLASLAKSDLLCFLDADVRLAPDALTRMVLFLTRSRSDLVSGFPRQETESTLEWLLLPLIHFVLLSYLPLAAMRLLPAPGFGVGLWPIYSGAPRGLSQDRRPR